MTRVILGACALACPLMMVAMMVSMRGRRGEDQWKAKDGEKE